jgi:CheY-like chemotaxis protein
MPQSDSGPSSDAKTIVAIDDNREYLALVRDVLETEDYRLVTCEDASQAFGVVKGVRPALVILDVKMPKMVDWQLFDVLKLDPSTTAIPVLVCSAAHQDVRERERRLHDQGCEVLLKPFNLDELVEKVERLTA